MRGNIEVMAKKGWFHALTALVHSLGDSRPSRLRGRRFFIYHTIVKLWPWLEPTPRNKAHSDGRYGNGTSSVIRLLSAPYVVCKKQYDRIETTLSVIHKALTRDLEPLLSRLWLKHSFFESRERQCGFPSTLARFLFQWILNILDVG